MVGYFLNMSAKEENFQLKLFKNLFVVYISAFLKQRG